MLILSRLAYSWVMLDQEISLFYDENPVLPMAELEIALPQSDDLWLQKDASAFHKAYDKAYTSVPEVPQSWQAPQHSLRDLFQMLSEDQVSQCDENLHILHMRLLLYPIQTLVCQLSQLISCLPSARRTNRFSRDPCETSSALQLEEIKTLLKRWLDISARLDPKTTRHSAMKNVSMIIYHLINLNLCLSIPEIERIAREDLSHPTSRQSVTEISASFDKCIYTSQEALLHCGQVLRLLRDTHVQMRPAWSPLVMYRVTIALWAISISLAATRTRFAMKSSSSSQNPGVPTAIDDLPPSESAWRHFLKQDRGSPCLTTMAGQSVLLDDTIGIMDICEQILDAEQPRSRLTEGVAQKVRSLWVPRE